MLHAIRAGFQALLRHPISINNNALCCSLGLDISMQCNTIKYIQCYLPRRKWQCQLSAQRGGASTRRTFAGAHPDPLLLVEGSGLRASHERPLGSLCV
jgi:hypothetical protein